MPGTMKKGELSMYVKDGADEGNGVVQDLNSMRT